MSGILTKALIVGVLGLFTVAAIGGSFRGWFLPAELKQPVSLKEGSQRPGSHGRALYFLGAGRSHYGGGYRGGK
ncbi:MAG: hypothetical protein AB1733_03105 [Thermodesulfobacteriota bacterium]